MIIRLKNSYKKYPNACKMVHWKNFKYDLKEMFASTIRKKKFDHEITQIVCTFCLKIMRKIGVSDERQTMCVCDISTYYETKLAENKKWLVCWFAAHWNMVHIEFAYIVFNYILCDIRRWGIFRFGCNRNKTRNLDQNTDKNGMNYLCLSSSFPI